jgi:hypothetical protein
VDYIWANVNCEEIRVCLLHYAQAEGKLAPYEMLKAAYQDLKFRWKKLVNDNQGGRAIELGLVRPPNTLVTNPRYLLLNKSQ